MQVLFSRATRARAACRCFSCGQVTGTFTRQTTKATSKRRIGANDIFTACYSSLIASAVLADAEVKKQRRQQWDFAIDQAKSEASRLDDETPATTYSRISTPASSIDQAEPTTVGPWVPQKSSHPVSGFNNAESRLEGKLQSILHQIEQSLQTTRLATCSESGAESDYWDKCITKWTDIESVEKCDIPDHKLAEHLAMLEGSISQLVNSIVQKIDISEASQIGLPPTRSQATTEAFPIDRRRLQHPVYTYLNEEQLSKGRTALHKSIHKLCRRSHSEPGCSNVVISKICYNLLMTPTPPNAITLNILLGEFIRLRRHDLAELVIQSFFSEPFLAPTIETTHLMLSHYILIGDRFRFQQILNRMKCRGLTNTEFSHRVLCMRFGTRKMKRCYRPHIQEWASRSHFVHRNGILFQMAPRDIRSFNLQIHGFLYFGDVRGAVRYLKQAVRMDFFEEEWLWSIAHSAMRKLDVRAAILLFEVVLKFWKDDTGKIRVELSKSIRSTIRHLMALCGFDSNQLFPSASHLRNVSQADVDELLLHCHAKKGEELLHSLAQRTSQLVDGMRSTPSSTQGCHSTIQRSVSTTNEVCAKTKSLPLFQGRVTPYRASLYKCHVAYIEFRLGQITQVISACDREVGKLESEPANEDIMVESDAKRSTVPSFQPEFSITPQIDDSGREGLATYYAFDDSGNDVLYEELPLRQSLAL